MRDADAAAQPILLSTQSDNANAAAMRVYVEGAEIDLAPDGAIPDGATPERATYERVILLFDGRNEEEVDAARRQWSRLKSQGFALAYWQQTELGRWERRM